MKEFKVEVDQNNIIHLHLGNPTADKLIELKKWSDEVKETVSDVFNRTGEKIRALLDISNVKTYDSEALSILADLMKVNERYIFKTASFGGDEYILAAQDAILALSGRTNFKSFDTKEKALDWLSSPPDK